VLFILLTALHDFNNILLPLTKELPVSKHYRSTLCAVFFDLKFLG